MAGNLFKALYQMSDPAFRAVIWRTFFLSLMLFSTLLVSLWWLLANTQYFQWGWLDSTVDFLGGIAALIGALFLYPGATMIIISFMLDPIVRAVEAKHYPNLEPIRRQPVLEVVMIAARFTTITVLLNLIALPLYFIPVLNVFVFGALNGYLLGREYFELIAPRRLDQEAVKSMWRSCRGRLWLAGLVITLLLSIPFINWIMPVPAVAFMVHIFEELRKNEA